MGFEVQSVYLWILGLGFWVLDFGLRVVRYWVLDFEF